MAEFPLAVSRSVTLDSSGTGRVTGVGPVKYGESWKVTLFSVNTTSRCKFTIHRGNDTTPQYQIDATVRGDLDTSATDITLQAGETISFLWANGTPGAVGTIRLEGTITMRGR